MINQTHPVPTSSVACHLQDPPEEYRRGFDNPSVSQDYRVAYVHQRFVPVTGLVWSTGEFFSLAGWLVGCVGPRRQ